MYDAAYLPTIYDKVKVDVDAEEKAMKESWLAWLLVLLWQLWPLSGLYGVYRAAFGGDYLLPKGGRKAQIQNPEAQYSHSSS